MSYTNGLDKPDEYFNTVLWTGNSTARDITTGHATDFAWLKVRNATGDHFLFDIIRGTNNYVRSNLTSAEGTLANTLTAFNSDGFSLGNANAVNASGETQVGWSWVAGGTASSNTDGSITSNVSANTTSGFSIVTYTGTGSGATNNQTVGHGLGVTPSVVIFKRRDSTGAWLTYHKSLGVDNYVYLNTTDASASASGIFSDYTSSTFKFSVNANDQNASGGTHVAYCFAEKKGFSKFGSYTGNGSTDGTFVYTGFKPAFVIVKDYSQLAGWEMADNKRTSSGGNVIDKELRPNDSTAETTNNYIDFLSNGFKLRNGFGNWNGSGATYIYMCFAENPLVGTNNIPATAR